MMARALERIVELERVEGSRTGRARAGLHWLRHGGLGRIDAIYVESSTSTATPFDLAFLALARLRGRTVGVYFRDAYQLFRELFPVHRARQRAADLVWRLTTPLLKLIASRRYAPSAGLARVLALRDAIVLPPGTDPSQVDLGVPASRLVAAIVAPTVAAGFDRLSAALEMVRREVPDVRLRAITSATATESLPGWIELVPAARPAIPELVRDARVCVIPLPLTPYTQVAVPVRLMDLLAMGKPIVVTGSEAVRELLGTSGAAVCCDDSPKALGEAIARLIQDDDLAAALGARARAFALRPDSTWDARAATVVETLVGNAA